MNETHHKNITPIIFGPNVWKSIDCFISTLPDILSQKQKNDCFNFFKSLESLIPCGYCRSSYSTYNKELDTNIYNMDNYKKKERIIVLVFNLREKVNNKVGMEYGLTLNYYKLKLKYILTPNNNNVEWDMFNTFNAPFIQETVQSKIYNFLKKENIDVIKIKSFINTNKNFIKNIKDSDITYKNEMFRLFLKRNEKCLYLKNKIYNNQIKYDYSIRQSFDNDRELYIKLFNLGCSIFTIEEINELF